MILRSIRLSALALVVAVPALAADKDPVVAVVNGTELRASAIEAYKRILPPQIAAQASYEDLVDSLVSSHLVADQARKDGLEKDPEVRHMISQMLGKMWINRRLQKDVTDDAVRKAYDEILPRIQSSEEVHARHVLTETEEQAKAVIADLKKGGDFAEVAKAKSKDPSAKSNGGDLGYFAKDDMVPEFAEAAFAMKPGETSAQPVKSQFGWHVIKVEDRRMSSPPTFEQAKPALRSKLAEDLTQKYVDDLRAKAKIKVFNADGSPVADAKK